MNELRNEKIKSPLRKNIESFMDYLKFEKLLSPNTTASYMRDLKYFAEYTEKSNIHDYKNISHETIILFLESLFKTRREASVSRMLSTLRSFYKYLLITEKIKNNPFSDIRNPKLPAKSIDILDQEQVRSFLEKIPASTNLELRNKAMFELLYCCGLRVSEIINLKFQNFDFEENLVRFIGKGNKERIVPFGSTVKIQVEKYLGSARFNIEREKKSNYVFLNKSGARMTRQGFWKILKQYAEKFNFNKNIYPHIFRHSFATHMLEQGADLRIVQELLGHSSISTTEIYTNLDKKHIKNTYFKYHPRNNNGTK
jgi:integrase/recombinase XerD